MSGKPSGVGFGHIQAPWDFTGGRSALHRSSEKEVVCTREGREGKATGKCNEVIEIHQGSQPGMEWGHYGRTWVLGSRRLQQQGDGEHRSCRDQTTRRAVTVRGAHSSALCILHYQMQDYPSEGTAREQVNLNCPQGPISCPQGGLFWSHPYAGLSSQARVIKCHLEQKAFGQEDGKSRWLYN